MKKVIKHIICLITIIGCLMASYNLLKNNHNSYLNEESKNETNNKIDPATVLRYTLSNKNWSEIALSENFKNKYKSKYDIIPEAKKCKNFSCGYSEINGKYVIYISSDVMESIFDLYDEKTITYEFYFDYKINENNELDDIELIKTSKYKTLTCEPINEES